MKNEKKIYAGVLTVWLICLAFGVFYDALFLWTLLALTLASFIQNMAFTWVSRSRNSGDPQRHRYAAWSSNGVWLMTQSFIAANIYTPISNMVNEDSLDEKGVIKIILTFFIYAISTTEGSVFMMKMNLGIIKLGAFSRFFTEKGKSQVGKRS
jgi:hypothetical protein